MSTNAKTSYTPGEFAWGTAHLPETTQQASSFDGLLAESQELVCQRLLGAVAGMLDKSDEALTALIGETQNQDAQALYQDTRKIILAQRQKLERGYHKFYLNEFRFRTSRLKESAQSFSEHAASSLQLLGEDDLEETLKFKELATKLGRYCEEELGALDQRVGVLLGDANLESDANPFSPQAICDAYQQACHEVEAPAKVRGVLMKLFDDHVMDEVRSIYKAVNALLVKNSILPKIRYGVSKKKDGKPRAAGGKPGAAGTRAEDDEPEAEEAKAAAGAGEASIFSLLQSLVASGAGLVGAAPALAPGQVPLQGAELLGSLTRIQRGDASAIPGGLPAAGSETGNVLRELKTSSFGAGMAQMDAMTLDIVAMLFDQLFDDPQIPIGLKGLIGRMQIPMLKVALADKSFFSKKTHPAREVLDTFGDIALRLPPDFTSSSPLFAKLEAIVQQLLDGFQEDVAIFDAAKEQLRAIIVEEDRRVEAETQAVAERAAQAEGLAVAKTAAEDEVKVRVQAHKLPGPVLEFLIEHWLRHLLLIHAKAGHGSAEWKDAVAVMDQLIWSVEPKKTPEERRELAAAVPGLVKRLTAALRELGADDQVRIGFFGELVKYHTELLGTGAKAKGAAAPEPVAAPAPGAAAPKAPTLDFTAPVTVNNPYGGGQVQVSGLDFTAGATSKSKAGAIVDPPEDLDMGRTWVEFRPKGEQEHRALKLLFVPPKKTRYVFTDRKGKTFLELTRTELVRQLRTGEAVRLEGEPEEPLFDRIMHGLVDKLRAPASPAA